MQSPTIDVPDGYVELLQEFTVSVLRNQPKDIISYAADYFTRLKNIDNRLSVSLDDSDRRPSEKDLSKKVKCHLNVKKEVVVHKVDEEPSEELRPVHGRRPSIAAEPYNPDDDDSDEEEDKNSYHEKTPEQAEMLSNVCRDILFFRDIEEDQFALIIDSMFQRKVSANETIITQGESGDNFYIIESGLYDVYLTENKVNKKVFQYDNKGSFGELALMYNAPRACSIIATTAGSLWGMTRTSFKKLVLGHAAKRRREFIQVLNSVSLLNNISSYERMTLADALTKRSYQDGEAIIRQGDPGEELFFIIQGKVRVCQKPANGTDEVELCVLKKGQYFGELALISKKERVASAYADGKTTVAVLGVESFERLLGPCLELMKRNAAKYADATITEALTGNSIEIDLQ